MEEYDVVFVDDDRKTILARIKVKYGEKAIYPNEIPNKGVIQGVKFTFVGWDGEEKLECIKENTVVIAKYSAETDTKNNQEAMYNSTLQSAEQANYNSVVDAGKKSASQLKAIEKDSRTTEEIVNDIIENGKTEVGQEINKDMEK